MPDLLTHLCSAQILRRGILSRFFPLFALGAILPDILSRPVHILFPAAYPFVQPFHSAIVCALCCVLVSLLFAPGIRGACLGCLLAGSGLHLALDAFQKQTGPEYPWLFPFSGYSGSIGLFWPEEALFLLPATLALTAFVAALRRRSRARVTRRRPPAPPG